jgi:hypothetical protein
MVLAAAEAQGRGGINTRASAFRERRGMRQYAMKSE